MKISYFIIVLISTFFVPQSFGSGLHDAIILFEHNGYKISKSCSDKGDECSIKIRYKKNEKTSINNIPNLNWQVSVDPTGNNYQISASCGTGCGVNYFFTPPNKINGPYPQILAFRNDKTMFAIFNESQSTVEVYYVGVAKPDKAFHIDLGGIYWQSYILSAKFKDGYFYIRYIAKDHKQVNKKYRIYSN